MNRIAEAAGNIFTGQELEVFLKHLQLNDLKYCFMMSSFVYKEALDALKENAINDTCDPVITSRFKHADNLVNIILDFTNDSRS